MPTTVMKQIKVTELRRGDTLDETPPAIVESLTRKTTWGAVQIAGEAKPRQLRLDAMVTVIREEPTQEERAQARHTYMVQTLKDELSGWLRRDPAQILQDIIDRNRGYVEVLTWSNLPDVLKAQATFKHARTLWHDLGQPDDIAAVDEDSLLQAFASWWYTNVHQARDYGPRHDPISRSTSVISNIIDDCDTWAIADIRWRITCAGARDELQRRVMHTLAAPDPRR
jgi:hypothetical protein